jgi:hypothetical protein
MMRVVVLLNTGEPPTRSRRRQSAEQRQAAIASIKSNGAPVVTIVDQVLKKFGGKRISKDVGALGTVSVETTPNGVRELGRLEDVKAVLEDQGIGLVKR